MVLADSDRVDWVDHWQSMEYDGGGIGEATTADIVFDLDEVACRVGLVLGLGGGYFLRDRLAGWCDTVQFEDVEADVAYAVLRILVHLFLNHLDEVDGVAETEVTCANWFEVDREGDDRMDGVDIAGTLRLLVLDEGHIVAVVSGDLKFIACDFGSIFTPMNFGRVLRLVVVLRMEDDRGIVLAEVDGILAILDDWLGRFLVDGDVYRIGSGAYSVDYGVGVEHAVLVVGVLYLAGLRIADGGLRTVDDLSVGDVAVADVGEVGGRR